MRAKAHWIILAATVTTFGCGGESGSTGSLGSGGSTGGSLGGSSWTQGVFQASSTFAAQCASPRTGTDPATGRPYPDTRGTTLSENNFLRSWTNELYLWYNEVPDSNPGSYSTSNYFNLLKTSAVTPSGNLKDRFHFTYPTDQWQALSQSGVEAGYGAQFLITASSPPRKVVVAYTEPGSPATTPPASLARGAQVLTVDGVDLVNASDSASIAKLNEGLYPSSAGASHTFSVLDPGASAPRTITMVSANVTSSPVQNVGTIRTAAGTVGYMLFNDHIATAEQALVTAFRQLADAKVNDLVLDVRYNGGGYLDIASEVAYMIAGPGLTTGRTFEKTVFSDKHTTRDPVTGQPLEPMPFHASAQGLSVPDGQALPTLNLSRVTVLAGSNTCSASESIINGLQGVGVQVILIGGTTCGSRTGSIRVTTAARRTSRSSSRAPTTRGSATTRTGSPRPTPRARSGSRWPVARSPTTSTTRSAIRRKPGWKRRWDISSTGPALRRSPPRPRWKPAALNSSAKGRSKDLPGARTAS